MAQTDNTQANSSRAYALARRKAMSGSGKAALVQTSAAGGNAPQSTTSPPPGKGAAATGDSGNSSGSVRAASLARRRIMSTKGKAGVSSADRTRTDDEGSGAKSAPASQVEPKNASDTGCGCGCNGENKETCNTAVNTPVVRPRLNRKAGKAIRSDSCRAGSLARRKAMSSRGKAGINKSGSSAAQAVRASNPDMSSRELAKALRDEKSCKGSACLKKSEPARPMRQPRKSGAAQDASWKVGESDTTNGQTVTGTMVGRSESVTGDEASTCRDVTGTEYMGADIFKQFCQTEPAKSITRSGMSITGSGNSVTGNQVGRSSRVTGDEPGTCKNVTGSEYVGAAQAGKFCGTATPKKAPLTGRPQETRKGKTITGDNVGRSERVTGDETGMNRELTGTQYTGTSDIGKSPRKVGTSATLRGGSVTGTMIGRREKMTGDEPGSCRNVTGDDYAGQEQYNSFCTTTPAPTDSKVGISPTNKGNAITGTMTGRSASVTGDEPGTCKAVTGTPYAGLGQASAYCDAPATSEIQSRTRPLASTPGPSMTGQQPGMGGVMTGDGKGACKPVSGTPYVGADQFADACPATAATPASPDFPQTLDQAPWGQFSVSQPSGGAAQADGSSDVTGSRYEQGTITGPFGMAPGKVTGTEEARFGDKAQAEELRPVMAEEVEGRIKSRITGEGQDTGLKITGDDWERNEHVTGTEGRSATRRNPSMRMGMASGMQVEQKRNEELPMPNSKVTGGSGNTDKGSLITYSGGARG